MTVRDIYCIIMVIFVYKIHIFMYCFIFFIRFVWGKTHVGKMQGNFIDDSNSETKKGMVDMYLEHLEYN